MSEELKRETLCEALRSIADLPTGRTEEIEEGRESAYRAVEKLLSDLPPSEELTDQYLAALQRQVDRKKPDNFKLTPISPAPPPIANAGEGIDEIARHALLNSEMARTDVVRPVNGSAPYSIVKFHGELVEFYDGEWVIEQARDAGSSKAAAYAQKINDGLFELAKRAAAYAIRGATIRTTPLLPSAPEVMDERQRDHWSAAMQYREGDRETVPAPEGGIKTLAENNEGRFVVPASDPIAKSLRPSQAAIDRITESDRHAAECYAYARDTLFGGQAEAPEGDAGLSIDEAWDELVNVDDRTSPEEYPDMCLITRDELAEFMRRALPLPANAQAEGMVLVPEEPTESMLKAACVFPIETPNGDCIGMNWDDARRVWSAMIAASKGGE